MREQVIHFGPVWPVSGSSKCTFSACEDPDPGLLSTVRDWVDCPACRCTKVFEVHRFPQQASMK